MANFEALAWAALAASFLATVTLDRILYQKLSRMSSENTIALALMLEKGDETDSPYTLLRDQLATLTDAVEDLKTSYRATGVSLCTGDHGGAVMEALLSISPEEIGVEEVEKCLKAAELLLVRDKEATTKLEALIGAKNKEVQEYGQSCALGSKAGEASGTYEGETKKADAKAKSINNFGKAEKNKEG